jgi:3-dehydroquinate synthase
MTEIKIAFSRQKVSYFFDASFSDLKQIVPQKKTILITDQHIFDLHEKKFKGWQTIVLKAGEQYKVQATVDSVISQLIALKGDRQSFLVGIGGGVITDLTGYIASIFLRGVAFGFMPTTMLAMVDASIGGKNGIDVGNYKNMVGTINQPRFLLFDATMLKTLPDGEWRNGFAEIIKHAVIKDSGMFRQLEKADLKLFQKNKAALGALIRRNVLIKSKVVQEDEFEKGERRLLNFGHTLAHAIETPYNLPHGHAVAIGMCFAAHLSEELFGFTGATRLNKIIANYGLPTSIHFERQQTFDLLTSDKKKEGDFMNFVLLQKLGKAQVEKIPLKTIYNYL